MLLVVLRFSKIWPEQDMTKRRYASEGWKQIWPHTVMGEKALPGCLSAQTLQVFAGGAPLTLHPRPAIPPGPGVVSITGVMCSVASEMSHERKKGRGPFFCAKNKRGF